MNNDKIIAQVQKLLALSTSSNEHEAAAAAALAARLIEKHRISEAELAAAKGDAESPEADAGFLYETGKVVQWKSTLAVFIANFYGCAILNDAVNKTCSTGRPRKFSRYRLVGSKSDMELARFMFSYLTNEIERLTVQSCKGKGHVFSASYAEGCVAGIRMQMSASKQAVHAEAGQSQGLVLLDSKLAASKTALNTLYTGLTQSKVTSHRKLDPNAYHSGVEAGKNIHLGKALSSNPTRMIA